MAGTSTAKRIVMKEEPLNYETGLPHLLHDLTPNHIFYVRNHFNTPKVGPKWRLRIMGEVRNPLSLSLAELSAMEQKSFAATLECAGNSRGQFKETPKGEIRWQGGAVGTALWSGVPLSSLLSLANLGEPASHVMIVGADRSDRSRTSDVGPSEYVRVLPLSKAKEGDTLVALRMNGRRLPLEHGYPARLLVPGWYGMASVKWVKKIVVKSGELSKTYFNNTKYVYAVNQAGGVKRVTPVEEMRPKSVIVHPQDGQNVRIGRPVHLEGKAWSGYADVVGVQVNAGAGWRDANLHKGLGKHAWVGWSFEWTPRKKGEVRVAVRATDSDGNSQPEKPWGNEFQYGANAIQSIQLHVA